MHPRYQNKVGLHWDIVPKMKCWTIIELMNLGCHDPVYAKGVKDIVNTYTNEDWDRLYYDACEVETKIGHDVESFVRVLGNRWPTGLWHKGLASSDLVECWIAQAVKNSLIDILEARSILLGQLDDLSVKHVEVITNGFTHGQLAEPTTWGLRFKNWKDQLGLAGINTDAVPGKISGAVGTAIVTHPDVAAKVEHILQIRMTNVATQIVSRVLLNKCLSDISTMASVVEKIANDMRVLYTLGRISFDNMPVGSSSMAHKVNPYELERVIGMCKMVMSMADCVNRTNADNWLERDLIHSCVEREFLPTIFNHTYYAIDLLNKLTARIHIDPSYEVPSETWSSVKLADMLIPDSDRVKSRQEAQNVKGVEAKEYAERLVGIAKVRVQ